MTESGRVDVTDGCLTAGQEMRGDNVSRWYRQVAGEVTGPFTTQQLQILATCHGLSPKQLIRRGETGAWQEAEQVPELSWPQCSPSRGDCSSVPSANESLAAEDTRRILIGTAVATVPVLLVLLSLLLLFLLLQPVRVSVPGSELSGCGPTGDRGVGTGLGYGNERGNGSGKSNGAAESPAAASDEFSSASPETVDSTSHGDSSDAGSNPTGEGTGDATGKNKPPQSDPSSEVFAINPIVGGMPAETTDSGGGGSEFFGVKSRGRAFVYIVDCSGSMRGSPFAEASAELIRSLAALNARQKFYVILFDDSSYPMFFPARAETTFVLANRRNTERVKDWLAAAYRGGNTDPHSSLLTALELQPDAIYLLSDGLFDSHIVDAITRRNGGQTPINTIAFQQNSASQLLKRLADENRGEYRFIP